MKKTASIILLAAVFLSGCSLFSKASTLVSDLGARLKGKKLPTEQMVLVTRHERVKLTVEVADSEKERSRGLMDREKLEGSDGMWFVFKDEAPRRFWMKNTLMPLDILFFNAKKEIVGFVEGMQPCKTSKCVSYPSRIPAMYALEMPAGFVGEKGVRAGDKME